MIETGTPWRVRPCAEGYIIETARGRRVVRGSGGVRDREVAEHIARAVNGQAALVAACQAARRALAAGFAQDGAEVPQPVRHAMDLLERGLAVAVPARREPAQGSQDSSLRSERRAGGAWGYIGRRRECGCIEAVVLDMTDAPERTAEWVAGWIRRGLIVERVPADDLRVPGPCPHVADAEREAA